MRMGCVFVECEFAICARQDVLAQVVLLVADVHVHTANRRLSNVPVLRTGALQHIVSVVPAAAVNSNAAQFSERRLFGQQGIATIFHEFADDFTSCAIAPAPHVISAAYPPSTRRPADVTSPERH